jgi:phosphoglycerate dehydrogenase-like enzyme
VSTTAGPYDRPPRIALGPPATLPLREAVISAGGVVVDFSDDPDGVVWASPDICSLRDYLTASPGVVWVQLVSAGVDDAAKLGLFDRWRIWTSAKGAYAQAVAEHALTLTLAGLRNIAPSARAHSWGPAVGNTLVGARVTILGAGGTSEALVRLLAPFRVEVTVVRRQPKPLPAASRTVSTDELHDVLPDASVVILMLALTPATRGIIAEPELALMNRSAWLVNVARGQHVDTRALIAALAEGSIGGAALDVTDPEPLPANHPLWDLHNCIITPHAANPPQLMAHALRERLRMNVSRFARGLPLMGLVDPEAGY